MQMSYSNSSSTTIYDLLTFMTIHDHLNKFSIKSKSSFNLQGSESWLVSYDECEALGRQDVIISLHGNKFFSVSVSGIFHVSITYLPVVIQGKPIRVIFT